MRPHDVLNKAAVHALLLHDENEVSSICEVAPAPKAWWGSTGGVHGIPWNGTGGAAAHARQRGGAQALVSRGEGRVRHRLRRIILSGGLLPL